MSQILRLTVKCRIRSRKEVLGLASCHVRKKTCRYIYTGWGGVSSLAGDPPPPAPAPCLKSSMCEFGRVDTVLLGVFTHTHTHTHTHTQTTLCTSGKQLLRIQKQQYYKRVGYACDFIGWFGLFGCLCGWNGLERRFQTHVPRFWPPVHENLCSLGGRLM